MQDFFVVEKVMQDIYPSCSLFSVEGSELTW
jgi:hypothetical protein